MPDRPQFALIVSDITASLKFYISYLGFTAVESQPAVARGKFSLSPLDQNSIHRSKLYSGEIVRSERLRDFASTRCICKRRV